MSAFYEIYLTDSLHLSLYVYAENGKKKDADSSTETCLRKQRPPKTRSFTRGRGRFPCLGRENAGKNEEGKTQTHKPGRHRRRERELYENLTTNENDKEKKEESKSTAVAAAVCGINAPSPLLFFPRSHLLASSSSEVVVEDVLHL